MRTMVDSASPKPADLDEGQEASMGTVLTFPASRHAARDGIGPPAGSATVIILPVVRVEHYDDDPPGHGEPTSSSPRRKRRRRASRT
jgi:hypothetical protein